jgi:hypothetical protein
MVQPFPLRGSRQWRHNHGTLPRVHMEPGVPPERLASTSKEHFSMSRIAKGLVLTSAAAAAAVAGGAGAASANSDASGVATKSPGVLSGNVVQAPIHIPINICGNTLNGGGALNPAFGNHCVNR